MGEILPVAVPDGLQSYPPPPVHLNGKPLPPHTVFFLPAPPEIGTVLCGESTLNEGKRPPSLLIRMLEAILLVAFLAIGGGWLISKVEPLPDGIDSGTWILVAATVALCLLAFFSSLRATRFLARCAYVGELGAVRYTVTGSLERKPKMEIILFAKADRLYTSQTENYTHGSYNDTDYEYEWVNAEGCKVMRLVGVYRNSKGKPRMTDPFHFAEATELAWSQYLLRRADTELAEKGYLTFLISDTHFVQIGPGFIEFHFNGRVDRCEVGNIRSIDLAQGVFKITHRDAKWYSSKKKFSFSYSRIANARLFVLVLSRFLPSSAWSCSQQ